MNVLFGIEWSERVSIDTRYLYCSSDPTCEPRLPITWFLCGSLLAVAIPVLMHIVALHNVLFVLELLMKKFQVCCHALDKSKSSSLNRLEIVVHFLFRKCIVG